MTAGCAASAARPARGRIARSATVARRKPFRTEPLIVFSHSQSLRLSESKFAGAQPLLPSRPGAARCIARPHQQSFDRMARAEFNTPLLCVPDPLADGAVLKPT